ncbi:U5 small nuclear ribonucleoprotein 40 kDa protein [Cyclospora cayetanensis]|uniref:U5 small nuclear ribonucleoprotein 40 kDa protein n=1 Tax=Cyclospora cayetanensis TaxID=88456 RepID=A0A6P6S1N2_9EIME|nr:U5 small nuclear ribonucleoprotein 40 kDa protein [Cyclospora cayetanensis]
MALVAGFRGAEDSAAITPAAKLESDVRACKLCLVQNIERTSGLDAPTLRLTGHSGELYAVRFSVDGRNVATAGADRSVLVYNVYGECRSWLELKGHKNAILDLAWSDDGTKMTHARVHHRSLLAAFALSCLVRCGVPHRRLYTASADESLAIWDVETGVRVKKLKGHLSIVNAVSVFGARTVSPVPVYGHAAAAAAAAEAMPGSAGTAGKVPALMEFAPAESEQATSTANKNANNGVKSHLFSTGSSSYSTKFLLASGGDDGTSRVWDLRTRKCVLKAQHHYQILSVALDGVGCRVFAGSLDNTIREYDLRGGMREASVLEGHQDSITGLDVHPEGTHLLSNGMDHSVRLWDIQPFLAGQKRQKAVLRGALHNFEKQLLRVHFSCDGCYAVAGSSDRNVCIWDLETIPPKEQGGDSTRNLVYRLPGHTGSVNDASLHPLEPIVASVSSDKTCLMGELS